MKLYGKLQSQRGKAMFRMALVSGIGISVVWLYRKLNKYDLRNRVVLITGGSRGLGLILARKLAEKGAKLAICARTARDLETAKKDLEEKGAEVISFTADVRDHARVQEMIGKIVDHYSKLDIIINNAGIIQVGEQDAMRLEEYEAAMDVHFRGPLYTILTAIPYFKKQKEGRIVNITSIGGKVATPHLLPYTVSKFALVGLSEGMAAELKKYNIHVTTIVPFLMRTGSPQQISVKGAHEREYAWFKTAASIPVLAQDPERTAGKIIRAIEYGKAELVSSFPGRAAIFMEGLAPGSVNNLMAIVNRFLPERNDPGKKMSKKGFESESNFSRNPVAGLSDKAAREYNE
jgi:NAD(P)-dependent dehydrogenase (short-subunit alcohol dehydrogenase family)